MCVQVLTAMDKTRLGRFQSEACKVAGASLDGVDDKMTETGAVFVDVSFLVKPNTLAQYIHVVLLALHGRSPLANLTPLSRLPPGDVSDQTV